MDQKEDQWEAEGRSSQKAWAVPNHDTNARCHCSPADSVVHYTWATMFFNSI